MKIKKCKKEGCESTKIWSKGFCRFHTSVKPIKKRSNNPKAVEKREKKKETTKKLHQWFLEIWNKRREKDEKGYFVRCFETGMILAEEYYKHNSCIYSHYFPKSSYPQWVMEEWNIELVHPDIHAQWEANREKCFNMYEKFKKLKEKHEANN